MLVALNLIVERVRPGQRSERTPGYPGRTSWKHLSEGADEVRPRAQFKPNFSKVIRAPSLSIKSTSEEEATGLRSRWRVRFPLYSSGLWCAAVAIFPLRPRGENYEDRHGAGEAEDEHLWTG